MTAALGVALIGLGLLALTGCQGEGSSQGGSRGGGAPAPVLVAEVGQKPAPVELHSIGTVVPVNSVEVRPQVSGLLTKVHFTEGTEVKEGDPLFSIDDRPYKSALKVARSVLNRDLAQADLARKEAAKDKELYERKYLSETENDKSQADLRAMNATVRADRATLERAKLDLSYCEIPSPISGIAGRLQVTVGNLVGPDGAALVTINQLAPIYVSFTAPEVRLAEIRTHLAAGPLPVRAIVPGVAEPVQGQLTLLGNEVDRATGTISLRASFPNQGHALWPGQFVEVVLTLTTRENAVVVPSEAVQTGQEGSFVFVVKDDLTVMVVPVETDFSFGDETVITKGLEPGQRVVTDGHLRLTPGAKVEIKKSLLDDGATVP